MAAHGMLKTLQIRTNRCNLAYLSFIFESYDGLATFTILDGKRGDGQLTFFSHFTKDVNGLIYALQNEEMIESVDEREQRLT